MERLSFHTLSGQIFPLTPGLPAGPEPSMVQGILLSHFGGKGGGGGECRSKKWIYISSLRKILKNSDIIEVDNLRRIRHVIKRSEGKRKETPG
jgi:hypothetical protein